MTNPSPLVTKRGLGLAGLAAFGACAACCAVPLLAAAGVGGTALSALAGYIRPGADLVVAGLVGAGVLGVVAVRRRSRGEGGCGSEVDAGCGCAPGSKGSILTTAAPAPDEPIVCTADLRDKPTVQGQLDGYRAAFEHLVRVERFHGGVRWVFARRPGLEEELRRLAEKEHQCCKFFKFDLRRADDAIIWETTANEEGASVLEEFGSLPERLRQTSKGGEMLAIKRSISNAGLVFAADQADPK
jgi:hypothetical protein